MSYELRVTVACPHAKTADANQLALVLGESVADGESFAAANWQDAAGNRYAVMSAACEPSFANAATRPLAAPSFAPDADVQAATRAQAALVVWSGAGQAPKATPETITAYFHPNGPEALEMMGLTPVEEELV